MSPLDLKLTGIDLDLNLPVHVTITTEYLSYEYGEVPYLDLIPNDNDEIHVSLSFSFELCAFPSSGPSSPSCHVRGHFAKSCERSGNF